MKIILCATCVILQTCFLVRLCSDCLQMIPQYQIKGRNISNNKVRPTCMFGVLNKCAKFEQNLSRGSLENLEALNHSHANEKGEIVFVSKNSLKLIKLQGLLQNNMYILDMPTLDRRLDCVRSITKFVKLKQKYQLVFVAMLGRVVQRFFITRQDVR